jgi:hypothetical protein
VNFVQFLLPALKEAAPFPFVYYGSQRAICLRWPALSTQNPSRSLKGQFLLSQMSPEQHALPSSL